MATTILAAGTTAAQSTEASLAVGESATLFLAGAAGAIVPDDAVVDVQFKRADATWTRAYTMSAAYQQLTAKFDGPVTFRVSRRVGVVAVGVERA